MRFLPLGVLATVAACKAMPPPPVVAFHGDTVSAPESSTTAMLVVGLASQVLGGGGFGVAVRVEHQTTAHTALGLELTGGTGSDDEGERYWLAAIRGYGRSELAQTRYVAATYGAGLSLMNVGLVTLTLHAGGATSYPNPYASPFLGAGLAAALPLRRGRAWGKQSSACLGCFGAPLEPQPARTGDEITTEAPVSTELYVYGDVGVASSLGGTANALSLDLGIAAPLRASSGGILSLSIAGARGPL